MANAIDPIRVEGLRELRNALKNATEEQHKVLRIVCNKAADLVVEEAQRRTPVRTGKARKSIKAASTQAAARVKAGGARVPYFGWLDYGGRIYRHGEDAKPLHRTFEPGGRIIYPAYDERRAEVLEVLNAGLVKLIEDAGLDVTSG